MSGTRDNNAAKAAILGKIRRSLSGASANGDRSIEREEVALRLAQKERGIIPQRAQVGPHERIAMFLDYAEKVSCTTDRLSSYDDIPGAIAAYLRGRNLPQRIRTGTDPRLGAADWDKEPQMERLIGPSDGTDQVGVSHAIGGIAETGTALLVSGNDNPTTLNFLPETHVIVVHSDDIASDYESAQDKLRDANGVASMPRVVNRVTGPSRSGDIEQTILLGAHGPKNVHVIVVG